MTGQEQERSATRPAGTVGPYFALSGKEKEARFLVCSGGQRDRGRFASMCGDPLCARHCVGFIPEHVLEWQMAIDSLV